MKFDAREIYPDMEEQDGKFSYGPCSYAPIYKAFGEVLVQKHENDYQGSSLILLKLEDGHFGYLCFGWGSCSGCDQLQGADSYDDLQRIIEGMFNGMTVRESAEEMLEWFEKHDWEGDWVSHHSELDSKGFIEESKKKLAADLAIDLKELAMTLPEPADLVSQKLKLIAELERLDKKIIEAEKKKAEEEKKRKAAEAEAVRKQRELTLGLREEMAKNTEELKKCYFTLGDMEGSLRYRAPEVRKELEDEIEVVEKHVHNLDAQYQDLCARFLQACKVTN